jgi:hypothetical protein
VWAAEQARGSREGEQQRLAPSHAAHLREQGDGSTHARVHVGQQSMHARGAAERARSMTRTGSREGMRPGAIPACTEAAIGKCDDILSWGAWTRAGAAAQARGAAERARSGVRTGGREGEQPGGQAARGRASKREQGGRAAGHHLRTLLTCEKRAMAACARGRTRGSRARTHAGQHREQGGFAARRDPSLHRSGDREM